MHVERITSTGVRDIMLKGIFQILKPHFASMTRQDMESLFNGTLTLYLGSITHDELLTLPAVGDCPLLHTMWVSIQLRFSLLCTPWRRMSLQRWGAIRVTSKKGYEFICPIGENTSGWLCLKCYELLSVKATTNNWCWHVFSLLVLQSERFGLCIWWHDNRDKDWHNPMDRANPSSLKWVSSSLEFVQASVFPQTSLTCRFLLCWGVCNNWEPGFL